MRHLSRRDFLLSSAAAAAASAVPEVSFGLEPRRAGANDILRVACVGVKGRGMGHVGALAKQQDVHIAAIVDIDERVIDSAMKQAEKASGKKPAYHKDIRKMLEDKSIDAV